MQQIISGGHPLSSEAVTDYRVFHGWDESFHYSVGMHYHEHYEILLHGHGGTQLVVGQSSYRMEEMDLYIISPFHIHGILTDRPLSRYERTWLHITPAFLSTLGVEEFFFPAPLESFVASGSCRFPLQQADYVHLKAILSATRNLADCSSPYERMKSRLNLGLFFNELCHLLTPSVRQSSQEAPGYPVIQQVFNYIGENCTEDLSLDRLSERFNLSKYYLSHLFSQVYHVSTYRYILMCRIAMSQKLMQSGESMTSIAQKCGFNDYSNFLRSFQQITGVTPTAYQKRIRHEALPETEA